MSGTRRTVPQDGQARPHLVKIAASRLECPDCGRTLISSAKVGSVRICGILETVDHRELASKAKPGQVIACGGVA